MLLGGGGDCAFKAVGGAEADKVEDDGVGYGAGAGESRGTVDEGYLAGGRGEIEGLRGRDRGVGGGEGGGGSGAGCGLDQIEVAGRDCGGGQREGIPAGAGRAGVLDGEASGGDRG